MTSIISTTGLTDYLGTEVDAGRAGLVVAAVNDYIDSATGRSWGEILSGTEVHDYAPVIFLRHQDVITVTDVEIDDTDLDASSYSFRDTGRLVLSEGRTGFRPRRDEVEVTFTYGVLVVPQDLKLAALAIAADYYTYATEGQKEITSEGVGSLRLTYASGKDSATGALHFDTINRYRTRNV